MSSPSSSGGSSRKRDRLQMDAPSGRRIFTVEIDGTTCVFSGSQPPRPWYEEEEDDDDVVFNRGLVRVPLVPEHVPRFLAARRRQGRVTISCKRPRISASSKAIQGLQEARPGDAGLPAECAVCLQDFNAGDKLRVMPCSHAFHEHCIFDWLQRKAICPLCRQALPADEEEGTFQQRSMPAPEAA